MTESWRPPDGHPIDEKMARELIGGEYGVACRKMVMACCRPIYWFSSDWSEPPILANGTVTFLRTPKKLLGVTAAHVIRGYREDRERGGIGIQISNAPINDIENRIIDLSDGNDLATIELDEDFLAKVGGDPMPLSLWPPKPPSERSGIMLGGFPATERKIVAPREVSFGLFHALGISKAVTDDQITWIVERDYLVESGKIPTLPQNADLGGASGGPLITAIEKPVNFVTFRLGGIISQAHAGFEYVVAKRADMIQEDGTIERRRSDS